MANLSTNTNHTNGTIDDKLNKLSLSSESMRNLPSEEDRTEKVLFLGVYLDAILSLDGDKSVRRLEVLLPMVKDFCWSLSTREVVEAFQMYIQGRLPIEPRDNYLTAILFNKVISAYKAQRLKPKPTESEDLVSEEEKAVLVYNGVVRCFEAYKQKNRIDIGYTWVYDHLDEIGVFNYTDEEKKVAMRIAKRTLTENAKTASGMSVRDTKDFLAQLERKNSSAVILESKRLLTSTFFDDLIRAEKSITNCMGN